ncbi:DASH family cryptochrome [Leucothrix arctica]|uniref:Cryptochrome DASH n=1 Tax=Leucothrix arctica TaxID=1481894 RepID=A0A317CTJ5_9GAMM|nr:DASH family cryptochrome [Leucothrix arctica]PWQ99632.1 deoxyribodipyrimidine photolyase [Leucothrix arctica]
MTKRVGLYWFTNDLRLHDQPALFHASKVVDELVCYSDMGSVWSQANGDMSDDFGEQRRRFLEEALADLASQLAMLNQKLWVSKRNCLNVLVELVKTQAVTDVFRSEHVGWYENQCWQRLQTQFPQLQLHTIATHTLFDQDNLPFTISEMPTGFNGVRRKLEKPKAHQPIERVIQLPPLPVSIATLFSVAGLEVALKSASTISTHEDEFSGGESVGLAHLTSYLESGCASSYKQTRNALDGWQTSCKFSSWLALGCLSVRTVVADLKAYEAEHGANDSTYWIYVELLWREYFQWYGHRHGTKLYSQGGQADKLLTHRHNPNRIQQWIMGETAFPLVNACMTELRLTGFLSNRGRQIVASCLVNELEQDWRFGAAYFEQVLIDFDLATNWGNWQYIAGAGPASVAKKHFNLEKQAMQFDPKFTYTNKWLVRRDSA